MSINCVYEDYEKGDSITLDNTDHFVIGTDRINSRSVRDFKCVGVINIICFVNEGVPITVDFHERKCFRFNKGLFGYKCVNDKAEKGQPVFSNTVTHRTVDEFFKGKIPDGINVSSILCSSKDIDPKSLTKESRSELYSSYANDVFSLNASQEYSRKAYEELSARMDPHKDTIRKMAADIVNLAKDGDNLEVDLYLSDGLFLRLTAPNRNVSHKMEFASYGMSDIPQRLEIRFAFMNELCKSINTIKEINGCKAIIKPQVKDYDYSDIGGDVRIQGCFGTIERDLNAW